MVEELQDNRKGWSALVREQEMRLGREGRACTGHGEEFAFLPVMEVTEGLKQTRDII